MHLDEMGCRNFVWSEGLNMAFWRQRSARICCAATSRNKKFENKLAEKFLPMSGRLLGAGGRRAAVLSVQEIGNIILNPIKT